MNEERQSLLNQLNALRTRRGQLNGQIQYLEKNDAVQRYKNYTLEEQLVQKKMEEIICKIRACCHHVWYQVGFSQDKYFGANYWDLKCVACGAETQRSQFEGLDEQPVYEDVIFSNNEHGLSFRGSQRIYAEHEKMEGPEKAAEYVLALSRTPKGLK